uniref:KIB1-4 beta-propeller domain-containing protein n=1 Tax=Setaria italica TaxID=4555 RepID=K3Y2R0_SETIT
EWRDWANLTSELVEDIAGRLLSDDVSEYYRFRAVCRPWRDHTADLRARGALDRRFRPRNWVVLTISPDAGPRRRVINMATAASLSVNLPALTTHCHLGAVDGLLVLFHRITKAICLLDPLNNAVTEFPAISISSIMATVPPVMAYHFSMFFRSPNSLNGHSINGACLDESTSPPTLVLCMRDDQSCIIVAKPGDPHWTLVNQGKLYHSETMGRVMFHSLLSQGGRCYVASLEGSIFLVELGPLPQLVKIIDQHQHATRDAILYIRIISYLVGGSNGRMLLVRYWRNVEHFGGRGAYNQTQLFTVGGVTGRIEVSEVDIAGRTLIPVRSLGHYAAFVGMTHCMLVSTKTFPSIVADAIYLGYSYQLSRKFSIYYLKTRRAEPPHEFVLDENQRVVPCARPCNLDQYLVCYVDRKHRLSGPCINHLAPCP